ncbi:unnamed protein product [Parascedosporium putredinis]|uniref:Probable alpha/beta-glucosidase agdC n=1 Tax=Parascedosporium putredinis TaxID=1442378 RepID=A0A9P1M8F7_9PEZI|nr:unnamed protein product [Parascedosporium putredinis]CAI7992568.1 unnamed protein product [Parascedosporium putredinis]
MKPTISALLLGGLSVLQVGATEVDEVQSPKCPGYRVSNVSTSSEGLTAQLVLGGEACNLYGTDIEELTIEVTYETESRLHVKIQDAALNVYQVPESVLPRPVASQEADESSSLLRFDFEPDPFSFTISRVDTEEVIFDTAGSELIFESQYLRLRTKLPSNPNLYGLGSHTDPFRLNTTDYVRTLWNADSYRVPEGTNLYSSHPIYFEHRVSGTHGVFLLNSNGMDVKIDSDDEEEDGQYLEYNTIGGVLDFYFSRDLPRSRFPSSSLSWPDYLPWYLIGVVANYSRAGIPLETMYTDIDYMDRRRVFTLDSERFPLAKVRELVSLLHSRDQKYIMMVDPAVAHAPYPAFDRGIEDNVFLQDPDSDSVWRGVVWPGVTVFLDWFAENATEYWINEFDLFFNPESGVDIDGLWIDMNEAANPFCDFPCDDPETAAIDYPRSLLRCPDGTECVNFVDTESRSRKVRAVGAGNILARSSEQGNGTKMGLPGRNLLFPDYAIHNKAPNNITWETNNGSISNHTINTDVIHENGLAEYDTHNLYGLMMAVTSREAMLSRRPSVRPLIVTRSTFTSAGNTTGHWLGDNESTWDKYRASIRTMIRCRDLSDSLCRFRRVRLRAEHDGDALRALGVPWCFLSLLPQPQRIHSLISQEFYRWEVVAESAKNAIDIRYRLLDYIYTAIHKQTIDGTPVVNPMFFLYPNDPETYGLELQYFYGSGLLVAPVTEENSTSVRVYFPDDIFYDWYTHEALDSSGQYEDLTAPLTKIPLFVRGERFFPRESSPG